MNIIECDICSRLPDEVTSFYKFGNADLDKEFPPEVASLVTVVDDDYPVKPDRQLRRCPRCGTLYHYTTSYDYYVNGSEDEEKLERLTPVQARELVSTAERDSLIRSMEDTLGRARENECLYPFFVKSLIEYYLGAGSLDRARRLYREHASLAGRVEYFLAEKYGEKFFKKLQGEG